LSHTSSPFCSGYFGDGVLGSICLGYPSSPFHEKLYIPPAWSQTPLSKSCLSQYLISFLHYYTGRVYSRVCLQNAVTPALGWHLVQVEGWEKLGASCPSEMGRWRQGLAGLYFWGRQLNGDTNPSQASDQSSILELFSKDLSFLTCKMGLTAIICSVDLCVR
jgi:hypothetical protein